MFIIITFYYNLKIINFFIISVESLIILSNLTFIKKLINIYSYFYIRIKINKPKPEESCDFMEDLQKCQTKFKNIQIKKIIMDILFALKNIVVMQNLYIYINDYIIRNRKHCILI